MRRFLSRHILLPFFEGAIKRRNTFRYWRDLERTQWLSPAELEEMQLVSLRRLLVHAFTTCPYYRQEWLARGLDPQQVHSLSDFAVRWPLVTREIVQVHRPQMRSTAPPSPLIPKATGGSSGVPLQFDIDMESYERRWGATYRGYGWAGGEPGSKQLYLWGVPLGQRSWWAQMKDALYHRFHRHLVLNSFDFTPARVSEFLGHLNRYRPDVIVAYTNPLYEFARALDERKITPCSPRSIIVGAEKLHPFQRERIQRVFQAPVFETYGSREFMLLGAECDRHEGLHLTAENHIVEVVDDEGRPVPPGEEGNVVVTDLTNAGMPFIRYVNGDRAIAGWGRCTCGRGLPLLRKVTGRRLDMVRAPDGRQVPGEFFPHLIKDFPAIERFQVIQDTADVVQVRVVLRPDWCDDHRRALEAEMSKVLGPLVRIEFLPVKEIPLTAAGKLQVVVSRVPATVG